jgi:sulfonate transport system ATP-binding protein
MTTVIAKNIRRDFDGRAVLRGLEVSLEDGEFVALLGRSGTGKSTLLRILGGLDPSYDGDVLVPRRRAVVFQEPRLIPWQRVLSNVSLGLPGPRGALHRRSLEALAEVGLGDHARAWPITLSGGEAQRVALARALVREPQLMLLDEPFGALDALTRSRMHMLLQDLCARHQPAVLLVTHDVDEAITLADRVLVIADGLITYAAPVELDRPRDPGHAGFAELRTRLLAELGLDAAVREISHDIHSSERLHRPYPGALRTGRPKHDYDFRFTWELSAWLFKRRGESISSRFLTGAARTALQR